MQQKTLLCVDDEPSNLRSLKRLLCDEDYRMLTAASGHEGLCLLAEEQIHVVISDQRMPEMTGIEFLQAVKECYPDTVRVVLSGYADVDTVLEAVHRGEIYRFLGKPWSDGELKSHLRQCFEHYDLLAQNRELLHRVQEQNYQFSRSNQMLESAVNMRAQTLELSQEILEFLPLPLLGVDRNCLLVSANREGRGCALQFGEVLLGESIEGLLPEPIVGTLKKCMEFCQTRDLAVAGWRLQFVPLPGRETVRGCIVIFHKN